MGTLAGRDPRRDTGLPGWLAVAFFTGAALMLAGSYWDDGWHTERGRDSFFIAPHIALYAGVTLAGAALSLWALLVVRAEGLAVALRRGALRLGLISVLVTLASAPIDNAWHIAFGRDAVIWSPPHLLGIVGIFGLASAVMAEFARRPDRALASLAGGGMLAAAAFVVVEYETDVPQFDELWYLPVLAVAGGLALALVRAAGGWRWAATAAAGVQLAFIGLVALFLGVLGFDAPLLPLLVVPAAALDLTARREWRPAACAVAYVATLYAVYVPYLTWLASDMALESRQVLLGLPVAVLAVAMVFALVRASASMGRSAGAAVLPAALLALMTLPATAGAHDPGQGEPAGNLAFAVRSQEQTIRASITLPARDCRDVRARRWVVRRAGRTLAGTLSRTGCVLHGAVTVPDRGRWFVYVELERAGQPVEAWLPIKVGPGTSEAHEEARYAYRPARMQASAIRSVSEVLMYLVVIGLLFGITRLVAREARPARPG